MTQPQMDPAQMAALVGVGVQAVKDRKRQLGLTWNLRPATVASTDTLGKATAVYDGDTEPIGMVDLTGNLSVDDRVMAMEVPPGGNYIIGRFGDTPTPLTYVDGASSITNVPGITVEATVMTLSNFDFDNGRAYQVNTSMDVLSSGTATAAIWRIRQGSIAGTLLGIGVWNIRAGVGSNYGMAEMIIVNTTGADVTANVVVTLERVGGGTIAFNTASTQIAWLRLYDIGTAAQFAQAISVV